MKKEISASITMISKKRTSANKSPCLSNRPCFVEKNHGTLTTFWHLLRGTEVWDPLHLHEDVLDTSEAAPGAAWSGSHDLWEVRKHQVKNHPETSKKY